jgi:hypothetical protein
VVKSGAAARPTSARALSPSACATSSISQPPMLDPISTTSSRPCVAINATTSSRQRERVPWAKSPSDRPQPE